MGGVPPARGHPGRSGQAPAEPSLAARRFPAQEAAAAWKAARRVAVAVWATRPLQSGWERASYIGMGWMQNISGLTDHEAGMLLALAATLAVLGWRWRSKGEEPKSRPEEPVYGHSFECESLLNQMQNERELLFQSHRAPVGSCGARGRRVMAARESLRELDIFPKEI